MIAIGFSGLLCFNLGAMPSFAESQANDVPIQGLPGRRVGGGTRHPDGHTGQMPLVALVPETNLSITTATHPRFLFHLPAASQAREVEFILYDETDALVYETTLLVEPVSGLFSINLAEAEGLDPFQLNASYHWYFSIVADDRAQDISVDGWTRRVDLLTWIQTQELDQEFLLRLDTAAPLERARLLYKKAQLWHDAAVLLAELQQASPNNPAIAEEWNNLMEAENLAGLGAVPMEAFYAAPIGDTGNTASWLN